MDKLRQEIFNKYNARCAYCGCSIETKSFHVDHIEPIFRKWNEDGTQRNISRENNLLKLFNPSCVSCNLRKSVLSVEDFRKELECTLKRLHKIGTYKMALKYGLIKEKESNVKFHFEKVGEISSL